MVQKFATLDQGPDFDCLYPCIFREVSKLLWYPLRHFRSNLRLIRPQTQCERPQLFETGWLNIDTEAL